MVQMMYLLNIKTSISLAETKTFDESKLVWILMHSYSLFDKNFLSLFSLFL